MSDEKHQIDSLYSHVFSDIKRGTPEDREEFKSITYEILKNKDFRSLSKIIHHYHTSRLMHSMRVAYDTYLFCKKKGWDYISAARGAMLHDWFRVDRGCIKRRVKYLLGFYHPRMAMNTAMENFTLNNIEKNCILRHMFPLTIIPPKYKEAWGIVYYDKIWGIKEYFGYTPQYA